MAPNPTTPLAALAVALTTALAALTPSAATTPDPAPAAVAPALVRAPDSLPAPDSAPGLTPAPVPGPARACAGARSCWVDVSVAQVWTSPDLVREVDAPALRHPADLRGWLAALGPDGEARRTVPGETQALYGTPVTVEATRRDADGLLWDRVRVHGQPTPKDPGGAYPGWIPDRQLTSTRPRPPADAAPRHVTTRTAWAWTTAAGAAAAATTGRATEYSYGTVFPVRPSGTKGVERATAHDGTALYLRSGDLAALPARPTGAAVLTEARKFLGLYYLWSGASGFGQDCSGLTSQVYAALGVTVPRDAQPQFDAGGGAAPAGSAKGTRIEPEDLAALRPGDVVAFGEDPDRITHVGLYTGTKNGRPLMIDAPGTGLRTQEEPILTTHRTYQGATRFLP
ncbi:NlpC/P60 family protein [Streptomyces sp. NPDC097619]|uniref:C40 family peptidase n=1 Tax=Streptomyces sp. NPDC097619 TaxID=3157228 RepID=UPI0033178BA9